MVHFNEAECSDHNRSYLVWRISLSLLPFWIRLMQVCAHMHVPARHHHFLPRATRATGRIPQKGWCSACG